MKYIHIVEYRTMETKEYAFSRYYSSEKQAKEGVRRDSRRYGITPRYAKTSSFLYVMDDYANPFHMNEDYKDGTYPAIITKREINKF